MCEFKLVGYLRPLGGAEEGVAPAASGTKVWPNVYVLGVWRSKPSVAVLYVRCDESVIPGVK